MKRARAQSSERNRGGRPPKFREPRRPVTVTLPERTLRLLDAVDKDRARAIVRVTDAALPPADTPESKLVEVVEVMPGVGIILVGPSQSLRQISWLRLVEVAPARFLLSIPSGTPVDSLEIALADILEASPSVDARERAILERLHALMRTLRRGRSVSKAEMLFVDTSGRGRREATGNGGRGGTAATVPVEWRREGPRP
jgi:hypothetical protein